MKIIVDSLGGDNAPGEILLGCADALKNDPDLELVIVGDPSLIEATIVKEGADIKRVESILSTQAVLNTDHPANFLREKPNCSLAICYEEAKRREDIQAVVSAGPTGAVLAGGMFKLGRMKGVKRPALMANIPTTAEGKTARILDAGANMDCKADWLLQFAIMSSAYLKAIGIDNPRIGLLNVGSEEGKGNELAKEAYGLLKNSGVNFIGNIEADHITKGEADAIVCDGFWGNVYCKATESTALWISGLFKDVFYKNFLTKIGALFMKRHLGEVRKPIDAAKKASAPLLGVNKIVLKCHGHAKRESVSMTISEASFLIRQDLQGEIAKAIEAASIIENQPAGNE